MPTLVTSATLSLFYHVSISCRRISALLLPLFVFGSLFFLGSSTLKTFKQFLSDEPWCHISISLTKLFCAFSVFDVYNSDNNNGLYNPTNNNKRKWSFNTTFINFRLFASKYDQEKVDLSFAGYECLNAVKLNWSWQLNLIDPKPVCIIKAILLVVALFLNPIFAPYSCHIIKLVFKLSLKINKIKISVVKEKVETI